MKEINEIIILLLPKLIPTLNLFPHFNSFFKNIDLFQSTSTGSLPKWPSRSGLGQKEAMRLELHVDGASEWQGPKHLGHLCSSPSALAGSWIRKSAGTQSGAFMGSKGCKRWSEVSSTEIPTPWFNSCLKLAPLLQRSWGILTDLGKSSLCLRWYFALVHLSLSLPGAVALGPLWLSNPRAPPDSSVNWYSIAMQATHSAVPCKSLLSYL